MNEQVCKVGIASDRRAGLTTDNPYKNVSDLINEAIRQAGLGQRNPDVPMADIIQPGMTVLLKPNWVNHLNHSGLGMDCLITNPNFVIAVVKEVVAAAPGRIIIGDAPIQSCQFHSIVNSEWRHEVARLANCPVEIIDFRRTVSRGNNVNEGVIQNIRDDSHYILFDLAGDSLLEPISSPVGRFRVTNYDPDELTKTHKEGRHQYLLCREAFEADVIINLPKLKTHKKAGLTAALKNLVGLNGNKDYLPHHRIGGSATGGDCYRGFAPVKRAVEFCLDNANRNIGTTNYSRWYKAVPFLLDFQRKIGDAEIEGGWHGNDTVWRMVLDLNRILRYGRTDGTLAKTPLRTIYSLTDAVVAGELNGPLSPTPVDLGAVTFSNSAPHADVVHAALMGFNWKNIPLVRESFGNFSFPLTRNSADECEIYFRDRRLSLNEVTTTIGHNFRPPNGWKNHIEL